MKLRPWEKQQRGPWGGGHDSHKKAVVSLPVKSPSLVLPAEEEVQGWVEELVVLPKEDTTGEARPRVRSLGDGVLGQADVPIGIANPLSF